MAIADPLNGRQHFAYVGRTENPHSHPAMTYQRLQDRKPLTGCPYPRADSGSGSGPLAQRTVGGPVGAGASDGSEVVR